MGSCRKSPRLRCVRPPSRSLPIFEREAAVPELADLRAGGHDSEAVFDAPGADLRVSGSLRGWPDTKSPFGRTRPPPYKSLALLQLCHGRRSADADARSLDVDGSDPPSRHASIGTGEDEAGQLHFPRRYGVAPIQQSHAGRPRRAVTGRVPVLHGVAEQPDGQAVGQRFLRRLEAALNTLPGRIAGAGATRRGRRRGCASTPGPEPVPGPRTGGSLQSRPESPVCHGRTGRRGRKTLPRQRINGKASAHRRTAKVRIGPPCRLRVSVRL